MKRREFLQLALVAAAGPAGLSARAARRGTERRPNVLLITVDDMNCDSVGVFGCKVKDTTPQTDRLAGEGVRFTYAHVQVANCMPCRNVMQTGRYPHSNGVEGFYQVKTDFPILPDLMKENGYFIAIKGKIAHTTPYQPYPWDMALDVATERAMGGKGKPEVFHKFTADAIAASDKANKPFYLLVNITDPHLPFYGMGKNATDVPDKNKPSRVFTPDEIVVPGFLPDLPVTRKELSHYYSSVRRADDCLGATLKALRDSGQEDNTVVMFLSDHGMPFPFAKTNVYHHSTRTPWIVRWPGRIRPGTVDNAHMISAIDFMPTVLEIAGIARPAGLEGRSFLPVLLGRPQEDRDYIIKEYNENSGGGRHPMRSVETKRFCYIFNPWANGTRTFRGAAQGMQTYKEMQKLAPTDKAVAARLKMFDYRAVEEFYDVQNDADALHNLIDEPRYQTDIDHHREILERWMVRTGDHCLEAFRHREDPQVMEEYMQQLEKASQERRNKKTAARKKQKNKPTDKAVRRKKRTGLLFLSPPRSAGRGRPVTLGIRYKIPDDLGEQLFHVTLKDHDDKRIERKVEKRSGAGRLDVTFAVPNDPSVNRISFAAFVGEDFANCLQHVVSRPIPVE